MFVFAPLSYNFFFTDEDKSDAMFIRDGIYG